MISEEKYADGQTKNHHMTVAFIGPVDGGKSTLLGALLMEAGAFQNRKIEQTKEKATSYGRASFMHAYLVAHNKEEIDRAITIGTRYFHRAIGNIDYTFLDTPGHRAFFKSAIGGINQADVLVFVAPPKLLFQAAEDRYLEHHIMKLVQAAVFRKPVKLVFAISALDTLHPWVLEPSTDNFAGVFLRCKEYILGLVKKFAGGEPEAVDLDVEFVPVTPRLEESNILKPSGKFPWQAGTLINSFEKVPKYKLVARNFDLPLKIICCYDCKVSGAGYVFIGTVESGVVRIGTEFRMVGSPDCYFSVKGIHFMGKPVSLAYPGQMISIQYLEHKITGHYRYRYKHIRGAVLEDHQEPDSGSCTEFEARIKVVAVTGKYGKGWNPLVYVHRTKFGALLVDFKLHPNSQKVEEGQDTNTTTNSETELTLGKVYIARFKIACKSGRVVLHEYETFGNSFGKIVFEESQKIVALGLVTKTFKEN